VAAILPGSPAEEAGFRVGDLLVEVDGDVLSGKTPSEVQTHLERRLSGGWSCLVVLVRDGAPDVVRLRGTYTTFAQQRVLDCAEALRVAARRGDAAWEESLRFVAGMRDAGFPGEPLPAVQEEARRALRESLRELAAVPLPEGVPPEAQRLLAEARDWLGRAQRFREEHWPFLRTGRPGRRRERPLRRVGRPGTTCPPWRIAPGGEEGRTC
jgi:hypothetical protein